MKRIFAATAGIMLAGCAAAYAEATGSCARALETPLQARGALVIESISAGVTIVGTEADTLRVSCMMKEDPHEVRIHLGEESGHDRLTIDSVDSVHEDNLQIRIEVPRRTSLRLHMPAGQVKVNDLRGDKEIDLYAGQIVIATGDISDYRSVDASVDIGEVKASAWGVDKGGFFRTFRHTTPDGEYRIYAHLLTGQIELQ